MPLQPSPGVRLPVAAAQWNYRLAKLQVTIKERLRSRLQNGLPLRKKTGLQGTSRVLAPDSLQASHCASAKLPPQA
eukprot:scaffold88312_cov23-Tisochrysis_lutea.AAC.1